MTIAPADLALYAFGIFLLFITPGPVWVALVARALSGGFGAAWPLALGVVVGDVIWPFCAILGVSWILSIYGDFLSLMKWVACVTFIVMGWLVIRSAGEPLGKNGRLTRPGRWAGFAAGLAVIAGNPKAILFYMGMLPGFFDLTRLTGWDIAAICAVSCVVPLVGNLSLALFVDRGRRLLKSPTALYRMNMTAGVLLIGVGLIIPLI
ncbi:LysE family translocator [Loktanella sp. IMCC34160]|uniref:LysE family translocator n=1 Tax=Loktanella sp. IMCC34160 TaxID=2510646 RepID=UPI00101C6539|nr:LysE family translocator [Loktanella sp. IMCC34160]RYG91497.1 LysE family translocator [Loktanella sp. IMCC34160]